MESKKTSTSVLGILALIFSILGITFIIGIILAIIDLCSKNGKKKTLSIISLVICFLWIVGLFALGSDENTPKEETKIEQTVEPIIPETDETEKTDVVAEQPAEIEEEQKEEPVIEEVVVEEKNNEPEMTMGQKNALRSAGNYLDYTAFSYSGLISQLEYEGFTTEDATFAADNCGANWNEQAAKAAQAYLDYTAFSRNGLIEQLLYEGYTQEQAEYGVTAVGY